jgi:hypothetical protein
MAFIQQRKQQQHTCMVMTSRPYFKIPLYATGSSLGRNDMLFVDGAGLEDDEAVLLYTES